MEIPTIGISDSNKIILMRIHHNPEFIDVGGNWLKQVRTKVYPGTGRVETIRQRNSGCQEMESKKISEGIKN